MYILLPFPINILNYSQNAFCRVKCHRVKTTHFLLVLLFGKVPHSFNPESDFIGLKFWTCSTTQYYPLRKPETMTGIHSKFSHSTRHLRQLYRLRKETVATYTSLWNWQLSFISSHILAKDLNSLSPSIGSKKKKKRLYSLIIHPEKNLVQCKMILVIC